MHATLLSGRKSKANLNSSIPAYEQHDTWDASDVKTPLLANSAHAFSHPSLHAVTSPALDTHSAALWLAATTRSPAGKELVVSRPVSVRSLRPSPTSTYYATPLFDDTMDIPEPPFDYEVSMLYESQEGIAR